MRSSKLFFYSVIWEPIKVQENIPQTKYPSPRLPKLETLAAEKFDESKLKLHDSADSHFIGIRFPETNSTSHESERLGSRLEFEVAIASDETKPLGTLFEYQFQEFLKF